MAATAERARLAPGAASMAQLAAALREEQEAITRFYVSLHDLLTHSQPYASLQQGTPAWLEARQHRLTASNFATAAGVNPYCTARSLWQYLTGQVNGGERWEGNQDTARGTAGEPLALAEYTRLTGNTVQPCGLFLHRQHSWLAASPDGLLGDNGLLEIKCPRRLHDTLPPLYMAQVQGQLHIAERQYAHFFSFVAEPVSSDRLGGAAAADGAAPVAALYEVRRSDAYWAWLLPRLKTFFTAVQAGMELGDELRVTPATQPPHVEVVCLGRWG